MASLSELLQGAGARGGQSTWTVAVDFGGGLVSQYTFDAFFEDYVNEAMFPEMAVITAPTDGAVLTESPPTIDWIEPIGWADVVTAGIGGAGFHGMWFQLDTLSGSLTLNPDSIAESVVIPMMLDAGDYQACVQYLLFPANPAVLTTALTYVSGPMIDWGWPAFFGGGNYPDDTPILLFGSMGANGFSVVSPVDFDEDGDVDADDLAYFETCATAPDVPGPPPGCTAGQFDKADTDDDTDVDQDDFAAFQIEFTGSSL